MKNFSKLFSILAVMVIASVVVASGNIAKRGTVPVVDGEMGFRDTCEPNFDEDNYIVVFA